MAQENKVQKVCFTLNNYTEEEYATILSFSEKCTFLVIGKEVGENNTPHLQGYANITKRTRFSALKKLLPRAHFERAKGTDQQNLTYCTKQDKNAFIHGEPQSAGKRNDLQEFKNAAKAGITYDTALEEHSNIVAKYPRFAKEYIAKIARDKVKPVEIQEYRPWQQQVVQTLAQEPHDRRIDWIIDYEGGKGKTFLAKHLVTKQQAFYTNGGKAIDIFHAYQGQRIVIFDFVRETQDFVNYGAIEAIKNGIMSSNKYDSTLKVYNTPHVVVFANFPPQENKLSKDRLNVITI